MHIADTENLDNLYADFGINSIDISNNNSTYQNNKQHKLQPEIMSAVVPAVTYPNADTHKFDILKDNKKKTGIYR